MVRYLSLCVSGLEQAVARFVKSDIPCVRNIKISDGCLIYETHDFTEVVYTLPYVNNTFLILESDCSFDSLIQRVIKKRKHLSLPKQIHAFKLFTSVDGKLVSLDRRLMSPLIESLKKQTSRLYTAVGADAEFWVMKRRGVGAFFLFRLTELKKKTSAGELRPEIAEVLCRLSDPCENDVFCDPFCGSGAIALIRSKQLGYRGIFAMDHDQSLIDTLKQRVKNIKSSKFNRSFFIKRRDFFENGLQDGFIDVMVTDPPWGRFQPLENDFYSRFIKESARMIKIGGRMVVLTACKNEMEKAKTFFSLKERYDILVSGQKAGIFVFVRR